MASGKILGCGEPNVYITPVGGGDKLVELDVLNVRWSRALDEISGATVVLAAGQSAACLALLDVLDAFEYELSIYRDGFEVWAGPITELSYTRGDATIHARDLFQWFERRVEPFDRAFVQQDLSVIAAQLMVDGLAIDPSPNVSFTVNPCGVLGDRNYIGITYRRVADEVRELARSGLDFTVIGRTVLFGGREIDVPRLPTFTEDMLEIQTFRLAGLSRANHVFVFGANPPDVQTPLVGEAGGLPDTPIIQITVQEPSIGDVPSATAAAESRWLLLNHSPQYVSGRLYETAPVGIEDLIPGSIASVRQQVGFRYVEADFRLVTVEVNQDVSNDGTTETVTTTLEPVGDFSV